MQNRRDGDAVARQADRGADRFAGQNELLAGDQHMSDIAAGAAQLFGVADTENAGLAGSAIQRAGKFFVLVPLGGVGGNVVAGKARHLPAQFAVLLALEEARGVHLASLP